MLIKRKSIEAEGNHRSGPKSANTAIKAARKVKFAPVTLSEFDGVRYLHFGTEWVQGAMRLRKPDWLELEYAQQMMLWMLFNDQPSHVVQLGLGTGALTKFCYRQFPETKVTAVDLNPSVIAICESMFKLPPNDERLNVIEMDALDFVNQPENREQFDAMQIDLYDATAKGPVLESAEFYQSCSACLKPDGIATINLFGDHPSFARNIKALKFAFSQVIALPQVHEGNVVAIAFNSPKELDYVALKEVAAKIQQATKLPAKTWIKAMQEATVKR